MDEMGEPDDPIEEVTETEMEEEDDCVQFENAELGAIFVSDIS